MRTYTFDIDDKSYTLKYGYNAICELEDAMGKPIQSLNGESIGFSTIRLLLWAGLRWRNNGYTKQQVGFICDELVANDTFLDVSKNAIELLASSLGKGGVEDKGEL